MNGTTTKEERMVDGIIKKVYSAHGMVNENGKKAVDAVD